MKRIQRKKSITKCLFSSVINKQKPENCWSFRIWINPLQFWWKHHNIIYVELYSHIWGVFCLVFTDLYTLAAMVMLQRGLIGGLLNMTNHLLLWFVNNIEFFKCKNMIASYTKTLECLLAKTLCWVHFVHLSSVMTQIVNVHPPVFGAAVGQPWPRLE